MSAWWWRRRLFNVLQRWAGRLQMQQTRAIHRYRDLRTGRIAYTLECDQWLR